MKSVTVVAQDRVGLLADISYILGKSRININSLDVDVVGDTAVIAMNVKDPKQAKVVLEKNGYNMINGESIVVKLPNVPGEIDRLADKLNREKVLIEEMHVVTRDHRDGIFALNVNKPRKAVKLLNDFMLHPSDAVI